MNPTPSSRPESSPTGGSSTPAEAHPVVSRAAEWADRVDANEGLRRTLTSAWAIARMGATVAGAPLLLPALVWDIRRSVVRLRREVREPTNVLGRGAAPGHSDAVPGRRNPIVATAPASGRYVVVSDHHRGPGGRLDRPGESGVVALYEAMLDHYAEDGWTVVENGDCEEWWAGGGTGWGLAWDGLRLAGRLGGSRSARLRSATRREHLRRIHRRHRGTYDRLAALAAEGRYLRTIGNHDDLLCRADVRRWVEERTPGVRIADAFVLTGPGEVRRAVITHGQQSDAWNSQPGSWVGRLAQWCGDCLDDTPFLASPQGLGPRDLMERIAAHGIANKMTHSPRWLSVNHRLQSMGEVQLHEDLDDPEDERFPWVIMGHTHEPKLSPGHPRRADRAWARYANSGCAALPLLATAVEWGGDSGPPRLVLWTDADGEYQRHLLHTRDDRLTLPAAGSAS